MEKKASWWKYLITLAVGAIVAIAGGAWGVDTEVVNVVPSKEVCSAEGYIDVKETTETVTLEVPGEFILFNNIEYKVEDIETLEQEIVDLKEVTKDIDLADIKDAAVEEAFDEILDDYRYCNGEEFDKDEIYLHDVEDEWDIDIDDVEDNEYTVSGEFEIKYKDEDKCYAYYSWEVEYDGDDVDVNIELIE